MTPSPPTAEPRATETGDAPVWLLEGDKAGDNRQLHNIADALRKPCRTLRLRFNGLAALPYVHALGRDWTWSSDRPIGPPWPRIVLSAGRKSVAASLWIRRRSRGATRLVHVNRAWAPIEWFDLLVTTPQYGLPDRANVVANLMPIQESGRRDGATTLGDLAAGLARPWVAVFVGGDSRPYKLDAAAAGRLATFVDREVATVGGSAWIVTSPRTPAIAVDVLERRLHVPHHLARWGRGPNPYEALRVSADRFIVTSDSVSMLAEALVTGKPVQPFAPSFRPDLRWRVASSWRALAESGENAWLRRAFAAAVSNGLVASIRDPARLVQTYERAGFFADPRRALEKAWMERRHTCRLVEQLFADTGTARLAV